MLSGFLMLLNHLSLPCLHIIHVVELGLFLFLLGHFLWLVFIIIDLLDSLLLFGGFWNLLLLDWVGLDGSSLWAWTWHQWRGEGWQLEWKIRLLSWSDISPVLIFDKV